MARKLIETVAVCVVAVAASIAVWLQGSWMYYQYRPVTQIFESNVSVPDYEQGEDPQVRYLSYKKEVFTASFKTEVRDEDGVTICRGESYKPYVYEPDDKIPKNASLNWYIEKDPKTDEGSTCANELKPGSYYIKTRYEISQTGRPERHLTTTSNLFEVKEKK